MTRRNQPCLLLELQVKSLITLTLLPSAERRDATAAEYDRQEVAIEQHDAVQVPVRHYARLNLDRVVAEVRDGEAGHYLRGEPVHERPVTSWDEVRELEYQARDHGDEEPSDCRLVHRQDAVATSVALFASVGPVLGARLPSGGREDEHEEDATNAGPNDGEVGIAVEAVRIAEEQAEDDREYSGR